MRTTAALLATLLLAAALAGCASKQDDQPLVTPQPSQNAAAPPRTSVSAAPPPPPPPVPEPRELYAGDIKYVASGNDADQAFTVPEGAKRLVAAVKIMVTASGAYSVQGEGQPPAGDPALAVQNPAGEEWRTEFTPVTAAFAASGEGGTELDDFTLAIENPATGAWNVGVRGTGYNVHADVTVTAYFE